MCRNRKFLVSLWKLFITSVTKAKPMLTFKSRRKTYRVDPGDTFFDNGHCIQFLPADETKRPFKGYHYQNVYVPVKEWKRLKPLLVSRAARYPGCTNYFYLVQTVKCDDGFAYQIPRPLLPTWYKTANVDDFEEYRVKE